MSLFNKNTVEVLIKMVKDGQNCSNSISKEIGENAEKTIKDVSKVFPALYKTQLESLYKIILEEENIILVSDAVETLAKFVKAFPQECPKDQ